MPVDGYEAQTTLFDIHIGCCHAACLLVWPHAVRLRLRPLAGSSRLRAFRVRGGALRRAQRLHTRKKVRPAQNPRSPESPRACTEERRLGAARSSRSRGARRRRRPRGRASAHASSQYVPAKEALQAGRLAGWQAGRLAGWQAGGLPRLSLAVHHGADGCTCWRLPLVQMCVSGFAGRVVCKDAPSGTDTEQLRSSCYHTTPVLGPL